MSREPKKSARARGYSRRWERERAAFLRAFPLCGMRPGGRRPVMSECFDDGRTTAASVVDHVEPHRGDQVKFWDAEHNWQSQCAVCHGRKTKAGL